MISLLIPSLSYLFSLPENSPFVKVDFMCGRIKRSHAGQAAEMAEGYGCSHFGVSFPGLPQRLKDTSGQEERIPQPAASTRKYKKTTKLYLHLQAENFVAEVNKTQLVTN